LVATLLPLIIHYAKLYEAKEQSQDNRISASASWIVAEAMHLSGDADAIT
jgi:hypothetical protein